MSELETEPHSPICRRVWLFGGLCVADGDTIVPIRGRKAQSFFLFLVHHPATPYTRDALADLLWPDAPPERVRRYLSALLNRLRQVHSLAITDRESYSQKGYSADRCSPIQRNLTTVREKTGNSELRRGGDHDRSRHYD